jgi:hypothetical protein
LIKDNQEALKEPENCGPQTEHLPSTPPQLPSLLPHILLSRHNRDYRWPQKLSQGCLQKAPCNTRLLKNWPNHLKDPDKELDLFLLELTDLDPADTATSKSTLLSPTPLGGAFTLEEQEAEEVEETLLATTNLEEDLLTKSPMVITSRTWSPSPKPMTLKQQDHSPESSTEIEPKQKLSSPNSSDTSCSTMESQDSNLLFDKSH